ncbi:bestrophin-like domain [Azospirillum sp. ST 5-10]|uniref:bestrophin-like domain n=1 Tax=unclassified Azospirillum TaxID=2630922 RepID=UPI003F49CDB7
MLALMADHPFVFGPLFLLTIVMIGLALVWTAEGSPLAPLLGRCAEIVAPYAASLSLLFNLFVVFVATDIWSQRDTAAAAVTRQADAIRLLRVIADGLGDDGRALGAVVAEYGAAQTAADWREADGRRASEALQKRLQEQVLFGDAAGADDLVRRTAVDAILTVGDAHRDLVAAATSRTSMQKWAAAFVLAIFAQMALVLVHLGRPRGSTVANLLFSVGVAFILWVTLTRIDPFEGVDPISLEPIATAARVR